MEIVTVYIFVFFQWIVSVYVTANVRHSEYQLKPDFFLSQPIGVIIFSLFKSIRRGE